MRRACILFIASLLFRAHAVHSQSIASTALGYQEFTTTIAASATDPAGNQYYAGAFKGELRVNNQVLAAGQGGLDMYIVKMSPTGDILWHATYGGLLDQSPRALYFLNGALYLSHISGDTLRMGAFTIPPYTNVTGVTGVSKINAANGSVIWSHKTSVFSPLFYGHGSEVYFYGYANGFLRWDDQQLLDSIGKQRLVFLRLDTTTGSIRSVNKFTVSSTGTGSVTLHHVEQLTASRLFLALRIANATGLVFDGQTLSLPSVSGHLIFLKADTGFTNIQHRYLNPGGSIPFQLGYARTNLAVSSAKDSIAFIANSNSSADNIFYSLDGYNQSLFRKNALVVLDTQFITRRMTVISSHPLPENPVQYKSIAWVGSDLYLLGQVIGNNQAPPLVPYPSNVVTLNFVPGLTDTFNVEGPSRSFVVRTDAGFIRPRIRWLGVHTVYEQPNLYFNHLTSSTSRILFGHQNDNIWNPWVLDTGLNVLQGSMRQNADRAESTLAVEFLPDGSLIIVGQSHGKTLLDTSYQGIGMGSSRRDLFVLRRAANGSILWYKRIFSSYTFSQLGRVIVRNGKVYLFLRMSTNTNRLGYNYVRLDTNTLFATSPTSSSFSALAVIAFSGQSRILPLDDNIPVGRLSSVDIFPNGDIAAISQLGAVSLQLGTRQFPNAWGFYGLRLDSTGTIKDAIKFYRNSSLPAGALTLQMSSVSILPADTSMLLTGIYSMNSGQAAQTYYVHNGIGVVDSLQTPNYNPTSIQSLNYAVLINTDLASSKWETVLGPGASLGGAQSIGIASTDIYTTVTKQASANVLQINGQPVLSDTLSRSGLLRLSTTGTYKGLKIWADAATTPTFMHNRLKMVGNALYVSGSLNRSATFDTIAVSSAGFSDALTLRYDTALVAKQSYRLASRYSESMYDISVFNDTLLAFAYTAQESPTYFTNRLFFNPLDLEEDAFLGMVVVKRPVVPAPSDDRGLHLFPNPNRGYGFSVSIRNGSALNYPWRIFDLIGRQVDQGTIFLTGANPSSIPIHRVLLPGYYILNVYQPGGKPIHSTKFVVVR